MTAINSNEFLGNNVFELSTSVEHLENVAEMQHDFSFETLFEQEFVDADEEVTIDFNLQDNVNMLYNRASVNNHFVNTVGDCEFDNVVNIEMHFPGFDLVGPKYRFGFSDDQSLRELS